ncbi:hypothetical protein PR048_014326, partial [Dryococelus australis]
MTYRSSWNNLLCSLIGDILHKLLKCGTVLFTIMKSHIDNQLERTVPGKIRILLYRLQANHGKTFVPLKVCTTCVKEVRQWTKGGHKCILSEYLWCGVKIKITMMTAVHVHELGKATIQSAGKNLIYLNMASAIRPVPHGQKISFPKPPKWQLRRFSAKIVAPKRFTQPELNKLARELGLSKVFAELLGIQRSDC